MKSQDRNVTPKAATAATPDVPKIEKVVLPYDLVQSLFAYLSRRPFNEVANLIAAMQKSGVGISDQQIKAEQEHQAMLMNKPNGQALEQD